MTDLILVEQCKDNNRKAQMTLYKKYCDGMYIVAKRYMKNTAAAEDAMQESFIKAFQKLDQFKGNVTFGAWLKRIVINTCIDTIKSYRLETDPLNETVLKIADNDDDWMVHDNTTYAEVLQAIDKLPKNFKNVVQLFLMEGYDHQEISEILSISENVSRTNLHRGRSILKQQLKHLQYGTGY